MLQKQITLKIRFFLSTFHINNKVLNLDTKELFYSDFILCSIVLINYIFFYDMSSIVFYLL